MTTPRRHELTDEQWAKLQRLLPPEQRAGPGRPAHSHRQVLNGILWILRTGAPWRDLPERYGNWQTVYSRFRRWQRSGIWEQVFAALKAEADAQGRFDWAVHFVDGTNIRAHHHAAGARRTRAETTAEGSQGAKRGPRSRPIPVRSDAAAAAGAASSMSAATARAAPSPLC